MTNEKGVSYRLGLDLGTNSIGWAAVELDDGGEPCGVLGMGVRIFPDGRDAQSKASNAADRRLARGQRRRRDRYLERRGDLMDALVKFGLMPRDTKERKCLEKLDPYRLRARALDGPLASFELGRALFHLNQRRGFKSNRKADGDESEKTKISDRIGGLRRSIEDSGARTLGEFLAWRHEKHEPVRAREGLDLYPDRAMYEGEFDKIREAQKPHHKKLSEEQWDRLRDIIVIQRPLKPVEAGWCQFEYEDGQRRAARALPVFQEFRILQEVNNLRVRVGSEPERPLEEQVREKALARLQSGKNIDFKKLTGDLKKLLPPGATFNLSGGGREKIAGDETVAKLAGKGLFGSRWFEFSLEERNEIVRALLETEESEEVQRKAVEEWGLSESQAKAVAGVSLVSGYGNLSEKAIGKILPHLEKGLVYSDAVKAEYLHHSDFRNDEAHDALPYYGEALPRDVVGEDPTKDPKADGETAHYGRFPNPTVHIGLNQLRRVVNRLIEAHGKPAAIAVELARDLKMNLEQKRELQKQQREGARRNERYRECLESAEQEPTADALRKLRLWEEQGRLCLYTGETLSFEMVAMVASNLTEVDHILPFSKTLDNSMANMVVCVRRANRDKGDRPPYEAFGHSPEGYDYEAILARADKLPPNKRWRFQPDAMERFEDEEGFLDRQLNETRYLSRTARTYLAYLYDEKGEGRNRVWASPGRVTALLRRGWGLEGMLRVTDEGEIARKQRDDHRHHAVDALVVACTTRRLLQRFARAAGSDRNVHNTEERLAAVAKEAEPWKGFHRDQVKPFLDRLVVSHKPDHGRPGKGSTTGQLHNETAYGLVRLSETGPSEVVVRKKVADFKKRSELEDVRDPQMGKALMELWDEVAAEVEDKKQLPAKFAEWAAGPGVLQDRRRQPVRRVRIRVPRLEPQALIPIKDERTGKVYKYYERGKNEFADVWRMRDGSWRLVVVPRFYANQPDFDVEDFRPKDKSGRKDPTAKRLMRLRIDDMGALGEGPDLRIVRVRKITDAKGGAYVVLDDHNEANVADRVGKDMKESRFRAVTLKRQGFRKVGVDEIGRVRDSGPKKQ